MVARSTRSNQRPDTLMQDRRADRSTKPSCDARPDHTSGSDRAAMHVIGEETSQRLDVVPAQFRVIVTQRPKYACRGCEEAVVQAPAPERLMAAQFKSLSRASCLALTDFVPIYWASIFGRTTGPLRLFVFRRFRLYLSPKSTNGTMDTNSRAPDPTCTPLVKRNSP
jgi:zinc-finger binding domain of transposase IS66